METEKKKRGMPKGKFLYPTDLVLQVVTSEYKNTKMIIDEINKNNNMKKISWNTVQKYLYSLVGEGKVELKKVGKYALWKRKVVLGEGVDLSGKSTIDTTGSQEQVFKT